MNQTKIDLIDADLDHSDVVTFTAEFRGVILFTATYNFESHKLDYIPQSDLIAEATDCEKAVNELHFIALCCAEAAAACAVFDELCGIGADECE